MISAKRESFRLEIRRRQIDDKFRNKRKQYYHIEKQERSKEFQKKTFPTQAQIQFITEAQSILHNLNEMAAGNDYYIYQYLVDLRNLIKKQRKSLHIITRQQHQVVESLMKILERLNNSCIQDDSKLIVFDLVIDIMVYLIQLQEVSQKRIINSKAIQIIVAYLSSLQICKIDTLTNLCSFLGNAVRQSVLIAQKYTIYNMPKIIIKALRKFEPGPEQKATKQFIFFMEGYFTNSQNRQKLQSEEVILCTNVCLGVIDYLMYQDFKDDSVAEQLEDTLKVFKFLLDFHVYEIPIAQIQKVLAIISFKGYSIEVKRQALYVIDTFIYQSDNEDLYDLVMQKNLLDKIWSVDESLKYISLNILSNLALNVDFHPSIQPFLPQVRLQLNFYPENKFIYRFILNYLTAKKFRVKTTSQQCLINQLLNTNSLDKQIMQIEVGIWLGLVYKKYNVKPPLRILEAEHLQDVSELNYLLQREEKGFPEIQDEDEEMQDQAYQQ